MRFHIPILLAGLSLLAGMACGLGAAPPASAPEPVMLTAPAEEPPSEEEPASAPEEQPPATLPTPTQAGAEPQADPLAPGITETRWVWLDYPLQIKTGDSEVLRLSFELRGDELTPTLSAEGRELEGEAVEIPDVYETHTVVALANLQAAGLIIEPRGEIAEPLLPGEAVSFRWSLSADRPGDHIVTLSLRLRFTPKSGGDAVERTFWANEVTIAARDLFGLPTTTAALLGSIGSVAGTVLGFPFLKEIIDWLRRRGGEV